MAGAQKAVYRKIRRVDQCTQGGFGTLEQAQYGKIGGTLLFGLQNAGGGTGCGRFKPDAEEDDFLIRVPVSYTHLIGEIRGAKRNHF